MGKKADDNRQTSQRGSNPEWCKVSGHGACQKVAEGTGQCGDKCDYLGRRR